MSIIRCDNLTMGYEGKPVINNISFTVDSGDYLCIVGENGSGKSTLLNGLLKLKIPNSGKIEYDDSISNTDIGFLPQQREYLNDYPASVTEVVLSGRLNSMGVRPFYNKKDREIANENMQLLGISEIKHKCFTDLSGGQKQRVLLSRALCAANKILFLDEPTSGLDPKITEELYQLIKKINKYKKITVIMVSHDINHALNNATKILHLGSDYYFYGTVEQYHNADINF